MNGIYFKKTKTKTVDYMFTNIQLNENLINFLNCIKYISYMKICCFLKIYVIETRKWKKKKLLRK